MSYYTNKEMRTVTISIPQELVQKIDKIAMNEERSRSKMIEILLKKVLFQNSPKISSFEENPDANNSSKQAEVDASIHKAIDLNSKL